MSSSAVGAGVPVALLLLLALGRRQHSSLATFFFWRDLFLLTLTHYISKARRLPEKAAALTSLLRLRLRLFY